MLPLCVLAKPTSTVQIAFQFRSRDFSPIYVSRAALFIFAFLQYASGYLQSIKMAAHFSVADMF
jgi:hypothetical protein